MAMFQARIMYSYYKILAPTITQEKPAAQFRIYAWT